MEYSPIEQSRQAIQKSLDDLKTQEERNALGQFSTPIELAHEIMRHAKQFFTENESIRFLDPAFGTGAFYSALASVFESKTIEKAAGFEIDSHYGTPSKELWKSTMLELSLNDFVEQEPPNETNKYNLIICNPPYVRHHHISEQKSVLQQRSVAAANMELSGLAGLYCYFIALAHPWMKRGGTAGWLIPSEFMDVNYGQAVKEYLLNEVTLIQIHRFDPSDVQFNDALVSSSIVWFRKEKPILGHKVQFTFGGTLENPAIKKEVGVEILAKERKWTRFPLFKERVEHSSHKLSDFFKVTRGIATGDNKFFVLTRNQIEKLSLPLDQFRPILPSPRYLTSTTVESDKFGYPILENQLFVLDCKLSIEEVHSKYPALYKYLSEGSETGVSKRYLCKSRKIWYSQETRPVSRFYCTYIGRSDKKGAKPFRFILNKSEAIVTNSYLILYPKPALIERLDKDPDLAIEIHDELNNISSQKMLDEGRVYGGGMHKLEPKELSNVPADRIKSIVVGCSTQLQTYSMN